MVRGLTLRTASLGEVDIMRGIESGVGIYREYVDDPVKDEDGKVNYFRYGICVVYPNGKEVYIPEEVARRLVDEKADDEEVAAWMLGTAQ